MPARPTILANVERSHRWHYDRGGRALGRWHLSVFRAALFLAVISEQADRSISTDTGATSTRTPRRQAAESPNRKLVTRAAYLFVQHATAWTSYRHIGSGGVRHRSTELATERRSHDC